MSLGNMTHQSGSGMDFDNLVEKLLQIVVGLLQGVFQSGYEFLMSPSAFAIAVSSASSNTTRPVTFFVCALTMFVIELLGIKAMSKGTNVQVVISPSPEEWSKGIFKLDPKELLKVAAPFVLIVAAHSALVKGIFELFGTNVRYQSVFAAAGYVSGTVFLVFAVVGAIALLVLPRQLPRLRREAEMPPRPPEKPTIWLWLLAVPPWLVVFKAVHSYFILLSSLTGTSMWSTIGCWLGGTAAFFVIGLILLVWFEPLIFPEISNTARGAPDPDAR